ncbi:MAG: hypothetical protein LBB22_03165 [Treponema sp.]|nr:hypothetical protein [Treponema sp.]
MNLRTISRGHVLWAADWGVLEDPHKPAMRAARGWKQGGAKRKRLYAAGSMEIAPPFMNFRFYHRKVAVKLLSLLVLSQFNQRCPAVFRK